MPAKTPPGGFDRTRPCSSTLSHNRWARNTSRRPEDAILACPRPVRAAPAPGRLSQLRKRPLLGSSRDLFPRRCLECLHGSTDRHAVLPWLIFLARGAKGVYDAPRSAHEGEWNLACLWLATVSDATSSASPSHPKRTSWSRGRKPAQGLVSHRFRRTVSLQAQHVSRVHQGMKEPTRYGEHFPSRHGGRRPFRRCPRPGRIRAEGCP